MIQRQLDTGSETDHHADSEDDPNAMPIGIPWAGRSGRGPGSNCESSSVVRQRAGCDGISTIDATSEASIQERDDENEEEEDKENVTYVCILPTPASNPFAYPPLTSVFDTRANPDV